MAVKFLNRSFFQRIFGLPATPKPNDPQCWNFGDGKLLSVGKSTYTYDGKKVYGPPTGSIGTFKVKLGGECLIVYVG